MSRLAKLSILGIVLSIIATANGQDGPPPSGDFQLRVIYSGRLLGYFRQDLTAGQRDCLEKAENNHTYQEICTDPDPRMTSAGRPLGRVVVPSNSRIGADDPLGRVTAFWRSLQHKSENQRFLLLGMGDNLAPELGSRLRRFWWDGKLFRKTEFDSQHELLPQKAFNFVPSTNAKLADVCINDLINTAELVDTYYLTPPRTSRCPTQMRMEFAAEDNVVNFLLLSGYKAVVPGREDFLYGALWLQQLATKLRDLPPLHTVRLLAANLRVAPVQEPLPEFKWLNPKSSVTSKQPACPLFFSDGLYKNLHDNLPSPEKGCDRRATSALQDSQKDIGYTEIIVTDAAQQQRLIQVIAVVDGGTAGGNSSASDDLLREVANDRKIFSISANGQRTRYEVIVTKPDQELQNILAETAEKPYAMRILLAQMPRASALQLASRFGRTHKACIRRETEGVEQVYPFDDQKRPLECDYSAETKDVTLTKNEKVKEITLPAIDLVISEAQDAYQTEDEDVTYFQDTTREHARAYLVTPQSGYREDLRKLVDPLAVVLVRRQIHTSSHTDTDPSENRLVEVSFTNRVSAENWSGQNVESSEALPLSAHGCGLLEDNRERNTYDAWMNHAFEFCALRSLQLAANANVAMLQRRDFYFPTILNEDDASERSVCPISNGQPDNDCLTQIMFGRFLWKDDTPTLANLTGAQLKAVLTQSNALLQNDPRSEVKDVEQEWLVTFGVVKGEEQSNKKKGTPQPQGGAKPVNPEDIPTDSLCRDDSAKETDNLTKAGLELKSGSQGAGGSGGGADAITYCINGAPISDSQLYKVITSKALVENNQAYPGISTRAPGRPADDDEEPVVSIVGPIMAHAIQTKWNTARNDCKGDCFVARGQQTPTQKVEQHYQQRRLLHLSVQNAELSYSAYNPNLSDVNLLNQFGGVADSRASSPSSSSVIATDNVRILEEGQDVDWGALQTLDFSLSRTGNQQGGFPTISYASNNFTVGPLVQVHLGSNLIKPRWKGLPTFKLTISPALYQQQVRGNVFAFNFDSSLNITTFPNQARFVAGTQKGVVSRIGLRHEFNDGGWHKPDKGSYYEVGIEHNWNYNVLNELDFSNAGESPLQCVIAPNNSFTQCVKNAQKPPGGGKPVGTIVGPQTQIAGKDTELRTSGLYLDMIMSKQLNRLKLPTKQALTILVQGKGDYAFRHAYHPEYTTQAYYAFTSSIGLQMPIYGNLSIVPSYGAFFYENFNTFHSLIAKSATIDLRWTFDHYNPVRWASDLTYTTPPSTGPSSSTASGSSGSTAGPKKGK